MNITNNKALKPLVMAFIIIGSALSLGLKYYFDHAALSVDRPSFIKTTPDNQAAILFGNNIFILNRHEQTTAILNFGQIGLKLKGDFDFFSNGDLLVYSDQEEASLWQNLKQYARIKETRSDLPTEDSGFYRCRIETQSCQKFLNNLPAFHSSFRVLIDREPDILYIADTPKFVLYKTNSDGILMAQNSDDLHFPNQLALYDNELYIANTNKHSVKIVRTDTQNFGNEIQSHETVIDFDNRWPSELLKTSKGWWVSIASSNMSNNRIQIFDDNWQKTNIVKPHNKNADTWAMATFNNQVLVTDWLNIAIYQFNQNGEPLPALKNSDINSAIEKSKQQKNDYENLSTNSLIAFFAVFIFGIVAAFILEKKESLALFKRDIEEEFDEIIIPEGTETYWIHTKLRRYRTPIVISLLLTIPLFLWAFSNLYTDESIINWRFFVKSITFIIVIIMATWAFYRSLSVRIGISGKLLLIDEGNGTMGIGKEEAIQYSKNFIILGKAVATIGKPNASLFPTDELKKWVYPRIKKGVLVDERSIQKKLWALKHPSILVTVLTFAFMLIIIMLSYI